MIEQYLAIFIEVQPATAPKNFCYMCKTENAIKERLTTYHDGISLDLALHV